MSRYAATTRSLLPRAVGALVGLALPLTMAAPAIATTAVVKDRQQDGGLKSMTVKRTGAGLKLTTYFSQASDLHRFSVKEPGREVPTFRIQWRPERPKQIKVTFARDTAVSKKGEGACTVYRAVWDGPEAKKLVLTIPQSCLWIRDGMELREYAVNQQSYDETDRAAMLTDSLGYSAFVSRSR